MLVSSNGTQVILMLLKSVFWTFTSEKKGPSPEMASRALKGSPNVTINDIVLFNSTGLTDTTPFWDSNKSFQKARNNRLEEILHSLTSFEESVTTTELDDYKHQ